MTGQNPEGLNKFKVEIKLKSIKPTELITVGFFSAFRTVSGEVGSELKEFHILIQLLGNIF